ncbi:hypothetical protein LSTR_LSTR013019 [Laodelphax striatellus]|uniref:Uncharacterized protein n=1 Tax=Laodelphax striatellus TaxID=195883 RepID=A0A482WLP8_LAOST|nr:hypothetical protein LSTR_LSTR013019 [Laodelphax striatellus]
MCCPWLFFDGKLFHYHLARASQAKNLSELCDHRLRVIMKVERVRQAILEGLNVQFARPPLPLVIQNSRGGATPLYPHLLNQSRPNQPPPPPPPGPQAAAHGGGMSAALLSQRRAAAAAAGMPSAAAANSGGRLEIAGVVVGSWGPNYGLSTLGVNRSMMLQPQVTSVNAVSNYTGVAFRGRPSYNTNRGGGINKSKGRGFKAQQTTKKRSSSVGSSQKKDSNNKKTGGKGRGMTVVLPETGETVLATEIVDDAGDKKILMNRANDKIINSNTELVNGKGVGGGGDSLNNVIGQFEDACTLNGEGDSKINSIMAAATDDN